MPALVLLEDQGLLPALLLFCVGYLPPIAILRRWHQVETRPGCHQQQAKLPAQQPRCRIVFVLVIWGAAGWVGAPLG